jgi:ubiquinone/menaquinone biosynthesis C-methylase UbiE
MPHLTANDYARSCTSFSLPIVTDALHRVVDGARPRALLDVGCGYGGIAATLCESLGIAEAHGVDIDGAVIAEAERKGVHAVRADVSTGPLPYGDAAFEIVTCFGMLDYLAWFDVAIREFSRVLVPGGLLAVTLPNLASWHNRVALLLGYQPRDIEFCSLRAVGLAPFYRSTLPVGHLHTPTTRAFREFMSLMGFDEVRTVALRPGNNPPPRILRAVDAVLGRTPSSARRFLYIGRRVAAPPEGGTDGWWTGPASDD